ncbi:DoxX family protein [Novosphingobium sp.]|uniref:DoxX family protein n=1 Tax=Novosphingobium sp. TaxID=1874826 RepID=UPI00333F2474
MVDGTRRTAALAERALLVMLALPIAAFSLFVGYNKALAPMAVLVEHLAWTIHLPMVVGRAIGWLELAAATVLIASLVLRRLTRAGLYAAGWIALNHGIAACVHVGAREWSTLTQSAVVIPLCVLLVWLCLRRVQPSTARHLVG